MRLPFSLLAAVLAACSGAASTDFGSAPTGGSGGVDGAPSGPGGGEHADSSAPGDVADAGVTEAGVVTDASADATGDAADGAIPPPHDAGKDTGGVVGPYGFVSIYSYTQTASTSSGVSAGFYDAPGTSNTCTQTTFGACVVSSCPSATNPPPPVNRSAGTVTVSGPGHSFVLSPKADDSYPPSTSQTAFFSGGETISVRATGGIVPAFDTSVTAPSTTTITSPTLSIATPTSHARALDLPFTATGGGAGSILVTVSQSAVTYPFVSARCTFPGSSTSFAVPAGVFGALPVGNVLVGGAAWSQVNLKAGDATVSVSAMALVVNSSGASFVGYLNLY
jgi:hypothetical protein